MTYPGGDSVQRRAAGRGNTQRPACRGGSPMVGRYRAPLVALVALSFAVAAPAGAAADKHVIVTVPQGVSPAAAAAKARAQGAHVRYVYTHALRGYAATVSPGLLTRLRASSAVAAVLPDKQVRIAGT